MLEASRELHKYFHDCKDVLGRIFEKKNSMPDELGRDGGSVSALQRKHANFVQDLQGLENQVRMIQEESAKLQAAYAGDKAMEITNREREVVRAWLELQGMGDNRNNKLNDTSDLFKFFQMVRNLMVWMDDLVRQMSTSEKPRDVSGVELLMNSHQNHKAEIDARESNFSECISLGKELLTRNHYASNEIKEKLVELTEQRNGMLHKWEERWEHLQLILEVYQFARDAAVAEAWLIAQDPYLKSEDLGHTIDEVENLIKKHEAFEKAAAAQEERFVALERLTTFELKELKRRKDEDESRRRQEEIEKSTPVRHHTDRPEGERADSGSIKSGKQTDSDGLEAMLVRKHEWESTTKKASNRSWDKVCVVLRETKIEFYKDSKAYRSSPRDTYRGEDPIDIVGATSEIASDYKKKPHVFRLKLANCGEYLFQATSDEEMAQWVNAINQVAIQDEGAAGGAGRSQTLPEQGRKDEPKKRSFFTLKKK
jgi:spectrin beta